jgi:uncharacterized protein (TIGR02001 family)
MKKAILAATIALMSTAAFAADVMVTKAPPRAPEPSPFDVAFGAYIASDYNFRGISQSDRGPSVYAYVEPRYKITPNFEIYAGFAGYSTKLPTTPTGEFDIYAGIRPTIGNLALDIGFLYYWYPRETQQFLDPSGTLILNTLVPGGSILTLGDTDFWEVYGKATYTFNDMWSVGASAFYSPSWLNTGAPGTFASGNVKFTLPASMFPKDWGMFVSAEVGHYWLGTATNYVPFIAPFDLPDYTTWNVGLAITYKVFTLDVRYYDTDLSRAQCFILTSDPRGVPSGQSKWCDATVIGKLSFDITLNNHIK